MNRTWRIIQQDILLNFKRGGYLLMTFAVPVLVVAIAFGVMAYLDRQDAPADEPLFEMPDSPVGYVDDTGLFADAGDFAAFFVRYEGETAVLNAIDTGEITAYYHIPADYMETGDVVRYSTDLSLVGNVDESIFRRFLLLTLLGDGDPALLARLQSRPVVTEHQLNNDGAEVLETEGDSMANFWMVYAFAMAMVFSTFLSTGQLIASVIKEKENRVIEVVLSSVRPFQIMSGKIFGQGIAGLVQIVLWLLAGAMVLRITDINLPGVDVSGIPPSLIVLFLLYYLGGYALFAAFSAAIGAVSTSMREGPQLAMFFTMPAMLPIFFLTQIVVEPNGAMAVAFSIFPLTAPMGMVMRLVLTAVPVWQISLSLLLLFVSFGGGLWFATRLFRVNSLLSGQVPSRKQLFQLLRG